MSKKSDEETWVCGKCNWSGISDDIHKEVEFCASREEPEEWVWSCPDCGSADDLEEEMESAIWCKTCEDVIVKSDGDQCGECINEYADYLRDKRKDDALTGDN